MKNLLEKELAESDARVASVQECINWIKKRRPSLPADRVFEIAGHPIMREAVAAAKRIEETRRRLKVVRSIC